MTHLIHEYGITGFVPVMLCALILLVMLFTPSDDGK
jgi:hypothetical protein